jgi:putative glutamine amidotransferase
VSRRPLIVIPARFSASASALRFAAEVNARKLVEAVYAAGGEPLTIHPSTEVGDADLDRRLAFADGVLLPGGGDISPALYGGRDHAQVYDTDPAQDAFDVAVVHWAERTARPLLAICRGMQIVNVARGGTLIAHLDSPHRHVTAQLDFGGESQLARMTGRDSMSISCFHHQAIDRLGHGLQAIARSPDGVIEAVQATVTESQWFLGVQWHPEDTAATDSAQHLIFSGLVDAAAKTTART